MSAGPATELILIRHAPALAGGRLCGRTDVGADVSDAASMAALAGAIGAVDRVIASPALRCRQTAEALWPGRGFATEAALWEQDFGDWDGMAMARLPDLGPMTRAALASHRPPKGESFLDLCARARPAFLALPPGKSAIVAHAGTIRAALSLALTEAADALCFEVAPLSVSEFRRHGEVWSIGAVNRVNSPT
ncbi:MAG TPA: histidine phosphatase family protein [Albidovulum sp.]|uniref:histidine phosphatase family protein n=1 Tax=Albidovulum sp. TaxID=1872424 RepID=UPI002C6BC23C|nr:histidine phosphatase family protein [Albidovulum sp.]